MPICENKKEGQLNLFVCCRGCARMVMLEDLLKIDYAYTFGRMRDSVAGWVIETICCRCSRYLARDQLGYMRSCDIGCLPLDTHIVMQVAGSALGFVKMCTPGFAPMCIVRDWFSDDTRIIPITMCTDNQMNRTAKIHTGTIKNFFL